MFVHIGGEYTILIDSIIGLVNLETAQASSDVNAFLRKQEDENILEYVSEELPRSLVLTDDRTYVSPISVMTLKKRIDHADIKLCAQFFCRWIYLNFDIIILVF